MTTLDLEPIKDRLAKAHTEWGEWTVQSDEWGECNHVVIRDDEPGYSIIAEGIGQGDDDGLADATFIAHAPSDLAALVAEVERLRGQIDAAKALHKPLDALNTNSNHIGQVCLGCGQDNGNWNEYPCPTMRALDGEAE